MTSMFFQVLIMTLAGISVAGLVFYFGWLSLQVQYVVLADGRRQERSIPLLIRAVLPLTALTPGWLTGPAARKFCDVVDRRIISAGLSGLISGREIVLSQVWLGGISLVFAVLAGQGQGLSLGFIMVILVISMFFYPDIWLRGAVVQRHKIIQRGLPFVLDLLTLCVEAGLDFMSAFSRIIERRHLDALSEEMLQVFHGIKLGRTRRQALKEMRDRVNLSDLTVVINALIQADELGVSLGSILRIQSDQLRTKRFQRAETLANKAPTKLLFPLILFIFPAVFIILLGPVIVQMIRGGL